MPNIYADLATLKSPSILNVPDDAHDGRLLDLLATASRWIDGYCDRSFGVLESSLTFDGSGGSTLAVPDLISVDSMRVAGAGRVWEVWPADVWLLYPLHAEPTQPWGRPHTRIAVAPDVGRQFPTGRANVAVAGAWGYHQVVDDTGWLVGGTLAVDAAAATVTVSAAAGGATHALAAGHTIRIDAEQLYVAGAVDLSNGSGVTLTVRRGVNGTASQTHDVGAAVSVYRYPAVISEACLLQAAAWWRDRATAPFAPPSRDNTDEAAGVDPTARQLLEPYRRRSASLGV